MKKLFSLFVLFSIASLAVGQSLTPRFGISASDDNTGRVLTYAKITKPFATVTYVKPNAFETIVSMGKLTAAQTDSASVKTAYFGDRLIYTFLCDTLTAGRVVTFGLNLKSAGTLTVAKNKRASATFIFDGTYWVEQARAKE